MKYTYQLWNIHDEERLKLLLSTYQYNFTMNTLIIYSNALLVHSFTYFGMELENEILLCLIWIYFILLLSLHHFIHINIMISWSFHIILATNLFTNSFWFDVIIILSLYFILEHRKSMNRDGIFKSIRSARD